MNDTNNNNTLHNVTDYAELPQHLRPITKPQIALLRLLGLDDSGIEAAKKRRARNIVDDARRRRLQIYRETGRMVQQ